MSNFLWGIDLGGTKIELVVLEKSTFKVLDRSRIPTESEGGYQHVLSQILKIVKDTESRVNFKAEKIGIGTPGALDPFTKKLKNSNTICLNGKKVKEDLEILTGKKFTFANDANCFAVAETLMGIVPDEVPDAKLVFGVILGTGVGGGLVINGQANNGIHSISGEWGHNFLDESGGPCYCGRQGCVERVISGTALEAFYLEQTGTKKKLKEIVLAGRAGADVNAVATLNRLNHYFGKAISNIINILDPDAIILGGGVGNIDELYTEGIKEAEKFVFNDHLMTPILRPKLGDSAGVFGAALL